MKQIEAGEHALSKIFCSDFEFAIPDYQRPYSWGTEQVLQLLDDLEGALDGNTDDPYFLGSIVLVKERHDPKAQVIDGQQRLTTLSILFAVLRDLTDNAQLAAELRDYVMEPGSIMSGTQPRPRLTLRKRDAPFFTDHVQTAGGIASLLTLDRTVLETDAQRAIQENTASVVSRLQGWPEIRRQCLATMLATRTFLVVVSTPDLSSAHRIFSVMNARGLDLTPADIFKSMVIGDIEADSQAEYADKWEQEEQDLGRQRFAELFLHVRMIFAKERARRELLLEFDEQVLRRYLPGSGREFVDGVLIPYSDAYEHLISQNYPPAGDWAVVNEWLARLTQLDNNDWRPPALWALRHHGGDPAYLVEFLTRLERLAASLLIRRVYATPRATRYAELLRQLEAGDGLDAAAFALDPAEVKDTRSRLAGELYLVQAVRKYVLLRLDELLANQPGVSYQHKMITVEHVLPQSPKQGSRWRSDFTDQQREEWLHRLANLVLLNRAKNSSAQNLDFAEKKGKYFTGPNGVAIFALTTSVLQEQQWTPAVLKRRQHDLLARLHGVWGLEEAIR